MSRSTTTQPNQPAFPAPTPAGLCCPICGRGVFYSGWYPPDWVVCRDMGHWVGPVSECKRTTVNDGDNVLHAAGE